MPRAKKIVPESERIGEFTEVDLGPNPGPHPIALAGVAHAVGSGLQFRATPSLPVVRFKRLNPEARIPTKGSAGATGYDLSACLPPGSGGQIGVGTFPTLVPTGLAVEVPPGYDLSVRGRSGHAAKGLFVQLGTVDADYRGEIWVLMHSAPGIGFHIVRHGDRIAQLVLTPVAGFVPMAVEELSATERGGNGWGSTGR